MNMVLMRVVFTLLEMFEDGANAVQQTHDIHVVLSRQRGVRQATRNLEERAKRHVV